MGPEAAVPLDKWNFPAWRLEAEWIAHGNLMLLGCVTVECWVAVVNLGTLRDNAAFILDLKVHLQNRTYDQSRKSWVIFKLPLLKSEKLRRHMACDLSHKY